MAPLHTLVSAGLAAGIVFLLLRGRDTAGRAPAAGARGRTLAATPDPRARDIQALNAELDAFAYSISHELRTPLRHIDGYSKLLAQTAGDALGDEPRRYLAIIGEATGRMSAMLDALLEHSRTTRAALELTDVDPRAAAQAAVGALAAGRDIEWRVSEMPRVVADAALLRAIYTHLFSNALKFTAASDPAVIEAGAAGEEDGRVVLYVRDNGIGFDPQRAERLFGLFQRLHPPDEYPGTGIGLATVQRIIARHGGRVWAHAAPGAGATFSFTLAKAAVSSISAEE